MAGLPADELFDIVTFDAFEYTDEALAVARDELVRHNYNLSDLQHWGESPAAERRVEKPKPLSSGSLSALALVPVAIIVFVLLFPFIFSLCMWVLIKAIGAGV